MFSDFALLLAAVYATFSAFLFFTAPSTDLLGRLLGSAVVGVSARLLFLVDPSFDLPAGLPFVSKMV